MQKNAVALYYILEQEPFVVLYEITSKKTGYEYYIANPAGGVRLKFSEAEFANSFLCTTNENGLPVGVALYLEPSQQFYENNEVYPKRYL